MAKLVVMDEWHITFLIPANLPKATLQAIRQALAKKTLQKSLLQNFRQHFQSHPLFEKVRFKMNR